MKKQEFIDLSSFLAQYAATTKSKVVLFRGQTHGHPLLPKIARRDAAIDTTKLEQEMLAELRRRGDMILPGGLLDDWDLIVLAQHFGMATRLLDWSSNPLVAMWFACINADPAKSSFVYCFDVQNEHLLNRSTDPDPFHRTKTRVFKPKINNDRILAQQGWFTAHKHSKSAGRFVPFDTNPDVTNSITRIEIQPEVRASLLTQISRLGINYETMFPGIEGLCKHINWMHE